ncbi:hypothetical protein [Acidisphaera sp. S103]|uniref:hypothetical protein n=1 Tax=Acidisphaera sp. S103 TaxID=1747223 RepID=UPI00131D7793|nr:hypothetical protein [Acidisphaera sp. S103]
MISDEPDEDADALDDENLLETYVGGDPARPRFGSDSVQDMRDWPSPRRTTDIDAETLAWFKTGRTKWQKGQEFAPRTGIAEQMRPLPDIQPGD